MVKTIDTDGRVLVLRPDVTLPLVETAAREFPRSNQLLKFGYVSTVFREYYGRSTYGKDFLQGGIEILGDSSPECDGEVIVTAAEILKAVGVENIRIDIGTAAYTQALFDGLPISEEEKETLKGYMADRNLVACKSYIAALPVSADARKALEALPVLFGPYAQTLSKARDYSINSGMLNALSRLERSMTTSFMPAMPIRSSSTSALPAAWATIRIRSSRSTSMAPCTTSSTAAAMTSCRRGSASTARPAASA